MQRILPGMTEWRVAEVVRQRNGLDQVFVELQVARDRPRDLRDLQAMRQARAKQVAFVVDEDLRLVFEPAKRGRVNDAVAVALELAARRPAAFRGARARAYCAGRRRRARGQSCAAGRGERGQRAPICGTSAVNDRPSLSARSRMKRILPPSTFLSMPISSR